MKWIRYDITGAILGTGECPDIMFGLQALPGTCILQGSANRNSDYIEQGEIRERPLQSTAINKLTIMADGLDVLIISNAPSGVFEAVQKETGENVSGPILGADTFSTTVPGIYEIKIKAWPYLDFVRTIIAV